MTKKINVEPPSYTVWPGNTSGSWNLKEVKYGRSRAMKTPEHILLEASVKEDRPWATCVSVIEIGTSQFEFYKLDTREGLWVFRTDEFNPIVLPLPRLDAEYVSVLAFRGKREKVSRLVRIAMDPEVDILLEYTEKLLNAKPMTYGEMDDFTRAFRESLFVKPIMNEKWT